MADIEVVSIEQETGALTGIEKRDLFESLKALKQNASFFETFGRLLTNVSIRDTFIERPEILILKIRKIAQFPMVIPIVQSKVVGMDTIKKLEEKYGRSQQKPETKQSAETKETGAIDVHFMGAQRYIPLISNTLGRLDFPASLVPTLGYATIQYDQKFEYAWDEVLSVVGFYIDKKATVIKTDSSILPVLPGLQSLMLSGVYSHEFLQNNLFLPWQTYKNDVPWIKLDDGSSGSEIVMFEKDNAVECCDRILDVLYDLVNKIDSSALPNDIMNYVTGNEKEDVTAILPVLKNDKKQKKVKKGGRLPDSNKSDKSNKSNKSDKSNKSKKRGLKDDALTILVNEMLLLRADVLESPSIVKNSLMPTPELSFGQWLKDLKILGRTLDDTFTSNFWFDLLGTGNSWLLSRIYLATLGLSSPNDDKNELETRLESILKERKMYQEGLSKAAIIDAENFKKKYTETKYRYYYTQKFGLSKLNALLLGSNDNPNFKGSILDIMKPGEKQVIMAMASRDSISDLDARTERLPEIILAQKMRYEASQIERSEIYRSLRRFISPADLARAPRIPNRKGANLSTAPNTGAKEFDWIRTRTGIPLICPHVRDMFELMEHVPKSDTRATDDIRDYLIRNYSTEIVDLSDAYYCRICGESIAAARGMEGITKAIDYEGYSASATNELYSYIKKHVSWLVSSSLEFMSGYNLEEVGEFINILSSKLFNWIDAIERKILKARSVSQIDRDNYKKLLTNIYAYALLLRIVLDNPDKVGFRGLSLGKGGKKIDKMISWIVERVTTSYDTVLVALNLNAEYIQTMLLRAYDAISSDSSKRGVGKVEMRTGTIKIGLLDYIVMDPLYQLIMKSAIAKAISQSFRSSRNIENAEKNIKSSWTRVFNQINVAIAQATSPSNLLGVSIKEIEMSKQGVYDKVNVPNAGANGNKSDKAIAWLLAYTKSGIYREPYWTFSLNNNNEIEVGVNASYDKLFASLNPPDVLTAIAVEDNKAMRVGMGSYGNLVQSGTTRMYPGFNKTSDVKYISLIRGSDNVNTKNAKIITTILDFADVSAKSSKSEISFHEHKWDILVFVPLNKYNKSFKLHDYPIKELRIVGRNVLPEHDDMLVDRYCKICYHSISEVVKELPNISDALREHDSIIALYTFYISQCPAPSDSKHGNVLHDFGKKTYQSGSPCLNCGITKQKVETLDTAYAKRHLAQFNARFATVGEMITTTPVLESSLPKNLIKYSFDTNIISEFTARTYKLVSTGSDLQDSRYSKEVWSKSDYLNLITWIGMTEGHDIDAIKSGSIKNAVSSDTANENNAIKRRDSIHKVIMSIFVELDRVIWTDVSVSVRDHDLRLIVDSFAGVKKASLLDLSSSKIQEILGYGEYYKTYVNLIGTATLKMQAEFVYEYLLRLLLEILTRLEKNKTIKDVAVKELMLHLIFTVLQSDMMASKLKAQKRTEIEAIQTTGEIDPTNLDNDNSHMYDDLVDPDYVDKYGYEEMDYAGENEEMNS